MRAVGLGDAFVELLAARDSDTPPEDAHHAAQIARLLLQHGISAHDVHRHINAAPDIVVDLTQLPATEASILIALAFEPEHRPLDQEGDLDAFAARFGSAAGQRLIAQEADEVDLERYSRERGPAAAVRLLDALYELAAADERLTGDELRRLENAAESLDIDIALSCQVHRRHAPDAAGTGRPVPLTGDRIRVGRASGSDLLLAHPQVAPHHADLVRTDSGWRVVDARSGRATVLDGRPVRSAPLRPGADLRIGPFRLELSEDKQSLAATNETELVALSVRHLQRHIGDVVLLDDVSFTVFSGEVIAVVGPSGAGKTTLLSAITGIAPADSGDVLFDEQPFHQVLAVDRATVGSVPQDDIVHPELTVRESLAYGARLRLPPGETADPDAEVTRVLGELGISHIADSRIGDALRRGISGGQRKRANLGQELLSRHTRVLFLDEPTSGLDPRAAQDIVRLVRQLADRGRMVFLVTHDLSPQVMAQIDHLMVLVPGGRLAWFGPPQDACRYFGVPTPDAIFDRLGDRPHEEWGRAFRSSSAWRRFVASREALQEVDDDAGAATDPATAASAPAPRQSGQVGVLRQLAVLTRRYARVKSRDRTGLWVLGAQPPFLALVMAVVFPEPTASMLFMLTLSCLWFGMSAAVRELIADRAIWRRERRVGLGVLPYLGSKVLVLGVLSVLQCALLSTALWAIFDMASYGFDPLVLAGVSALIGLCGMALGLLVSATFSSSEAAVGSLPLLLIPQISLSALLVNLRDMTALSKALTWGNPMRFAFEAMLKVGEKIAAPERVPGKWQARSFTGPLYDYGFKGSSVDDLGLPMPTLLAAVASFAAVFLLGALVLTWRRKD